MILAWSLAVALAATTAAPGQVQRFAVLIGNNQGLAPEADLLYAERDAERMRETLLAVGVFAAENVVLVTSSDADSTRRALIATNDRIRQAMNTPERQSLLLVYYSGHADTEALHLGHSLFALDELRQLVRSSAATVRVLVVDACRSGALTRVKGGTLGPGFSIDVAEELAGEGSIFITSSAANEDSQESDALRGSFFSHHFVSALLGAAEAKTTWSCISTKRRPGRAGRASIFMGLPRVAST